MQWCLSFLCDQDLHKLTLVLDPWLAAVGSRKGETKWEDLELDDIDVRLKWSGMFHRRKRTPGSFMMRLKVLSIVFFVPAVLVLLLPLPL